MSALPIWVAMRRRPGPLFAWDRTIVGATSRWGRGLLVAQVALSVVLLIGAALLTRSLYLLQHTELGIRTADILTVRVWWLPKAPDTRERASHFPPLLEKIAALPSVRSVALASAFPRATNPGTTPIAFVGDEERSVVTGSDSVSPNFFETLGIPLLAGRATTWSDTRQTRAVAVVSESLARALSPDGNVLERHVRCGPSDQDIVIVGVVGDSTRGDPRNVKVPVLYRPALQSLPESAFNPTLLIATSDPTTVSTGVRQILREGGSMHKRLSGWRTCWRARRQANA